MSSLGSYRRSGARRLLPLYVDTVVVTMFGAGGDFPIGRTGGSPVGGTEGAPAAKKAADGEAGAIVLPSERGVLGS